MQQIRNISWVFLGSACLLVGAVAHPANDRTGFVEIAPGDEPETSRPAPAPPQGIRSFGEGAERRSDLMWVGSDDQAGRATAVSGVSDKISGASMAGSVVAFAVSPDGATAVYIADQQVLGRFELYSTPVDGSQAPTKISGSLPFGAGDQGVRLFRITPDSENVVFLADPFTGGGADDIFSVPIDGTASPVQLNLAAQRPITALGVLANGSMAAYFGTSGGSVELFKATINVGGAPTRLSNAGGNPNGNVVAADFTTDSSRVVYAADQGADNKYQWHSVSTGANGPGQDVQLSAAMGFVSLAAITPDNDTVVYTADETTAGKFELYSVPIAGGSRTKLNSSMAGNGVSVIRVSSDNLKVAYLADQATAGVIELFSAQIGVAGSSSRINGIPLSGDQNVYSLAISPDGSNVIYEADETLVGTIDLLKVPIDGSGSSSTLHALTDPQNAGFFAQIGIPIFGPRAVYPVVGDETNLFSVPIIGAPTLAQVNGPLAAGESVLNAFVPFTENANRLMAWGVGSIDGGKTRAIFVGPMRPDLAPEQINVTAAAGASGVQGYAISSDENYGVYLQDQTTNGKAELYSAALDSDADSVPNPVDNCNFIDNPAQNVLAFGQTVSASSKTTFEWNDVTDARFVRGPLSGVADYETDDSGPVVEATSYVDPSLPAAARDGFYYLFAIDCSPGGSFQTTPGAEPSRDAELQ